MNVNVICHLCLSWKELELLFEFCAWTKDCRAGHGPCATELTKVAGSALLLGVHLS